MTPPSFNVKARPLPAQTPVMSSTINPSGRNAHPPSPGLAPKMLPPMHPSTARPAVTEVTTTAIRLPMFTGPMFAAGGNHPP